MHERIKNIRNELKKTQQEFADALGISKSNLVSYEVGRRNPSDAVISLICSKYNINEEWLRAGSGEMHVPHTRNQQIFDFMNRVMNAPDEAYLKRLCVALSELDERELEALCMIAEKISKQD